MLRLPEFTREMRRGEEPAVEALLTAAFERAGFSTARAARLSSPYPVGHLALAGPGESAPEEALIHPKAFGDS